MKSTVITICLIMIFGNLFSQIEDLIDNYNITWCAKTIEEYKFEDNNNLNFSFVDSLSNGNWCYGNTKTLKLDYHKQIKYSSLPNKFFTNLLIDLALEGKIEVKKYGEENTISKENFWELISRIDTVVTFDPETFEEEFTIYRNINYDEIISFEVEQIWFYDLTDSLLKTIPIKISPIFLINKKRKKIVSLVFKNLNPVQCNINNENIIWAKETSSNFETKSFSNMKGNSLKFFKKKFWIAPLEDEYEIYSANFENEKKQISLSEKKELFGPLIDSVITFDPENYAETLEIIKHEKLEYKEIHGFKFNQLWQFDLNNRSFYSCILTMTPLLKLRTKDNSKPLYPIFRIYNE